MREASGVFTTSPEAKGASFATQNIHTDLQIPFDRDGQLPLVEAANR
jgi:hypothetical protein